MDQSNQNGGTRSDSAAPRAPGTTLVIVGIIVAIVWFLGVRIGSYLTKPDAYSDPRFYNLTRAQIAWDVFYGESPRCGDMPCHARRAQPADSYTKRMVLPTREMPLVGFTRGQKVYYRATILVPEALLRRSEPLVLHSRYIFARHFQFFVEDRLIDEGSSNSINVAIPRPLIPIDGRVTLAFVIDPGDLVYQGIANTYDLLIGPKHDLHDLAFFTREINTTYYLWFILPKLTFCLIFSLVFLFVARTRFLLLFVLYAFITGLEPVFLSDYAPHMLRTGDSGKLLAALAKTAGVLFLLGAILERFKATADTRPRGHALRYLALIPGIAIASALSGFDALAIRLLNMAHAVIYALTFATAWWLQRAQASRRRDSALQWFFAASSAIGFLWVVKLTALHLGIDLFPGLAWPWILDLILFVVLTAVAVMDVGETAAAKALMERELWVTRQQLERAAEAESLRFNAIARTTQMLAHDIRRPFTMLKAVLTILSASKDQERMRLIAREAGPEVNAAIRKVNGMLQDIAEISGDSTMSREPTTIEVLIAASLKEAFAYAKAADVTFDYQLALSRPLDVDASKVARVFDNIVVNAAQAMKWRGRLWFRARPLVETLNMSEVIIGNSGPAIEADDQARIFEAFFTKGKAGGTGLGLAIAKKVVEAHGGRIQCRSTRELGTEFVLTLPLAPEPLPSPPIDLPHSSRQLVTLQGLDTASEAPAGESWDEAATALRDFRKATSRTFTCLIVDDDRVFIDSVLAQLSQDPRMTELITLVAAGDDNEAASSLAARPLDLALIDIDLQRLDVDGFAVARKLRELYPQAILVIHSNRSQLDATRHAVAVGADLFIPKPISRYQLLELIRSTTTRSI